MMRRLFPDRHLAATDPDVVKHGAASGHDSDDVGEHGARRGPNGFPPAIELACEYSSNSHPPHHQQGVACEQEGKHRRKGRTFGAGDESRDFRDAKKKDRGIGAAQYEGSERTSTITNTKPPSGPPAVPATPFPPCHRHPSHTQKEPRVGKK